MTDKIASTIAGSVPALRPAAEKPGADGAAYSTEEAGTARFWSSDDGPSFGEFLDIINPLQHIPVVSTLYRAITGDQIGQGPRLMGSALFGGPAGFITSGIAAMFEEMSGGSVATHVANLIDEIVGTGDPVVAQTTAPKISAEQQASATAAVAAQNPAAAQAVAAPHVASTGDIPASAMNRISLNPAAALGVPLGQLSAAPAAAAPAFPARRAEATPFPAFPDARPTVARPAPATGISMPARSHPETDRVRAAAIQSRQSRADALLARWAEKQMATQSAGAGAAGRSDDDRSVTANKNADADNRSGDPAVHPMSAPRDASPEWYANAMKAALTRYRAGQDTGLQTPR